MELIEVVLSTENLNRAYKKVVANKGASGVDGVSVKELEQRGLRFTRYADDVLVFTKSGQPTG